MREALASVLETLEVPESVARGAEEHLAHIIIYAENFVAMAVEMLDGLGADQSAASGNQDFHEVASLPKKAHLAGKPSP